ncbi:hypothetical protein F5Y06DRAFT_296426 [Hypoxylon sp. FL0890]|nr:hypothetical protein F5Y06DRAFT_296426 [Hypoxylon sp. FL0890]
MEALAAVGLASNILQLIECGYKVNVMAKELHRSGHDATQTNKSAAFGVQELRELSLSVMNDLPASDLSDDEKALDSLKVKNPKRKLGTVIVVFRNMRKRGEREQLQACLDNYRMQLSVQINKMSRSDLVRRLEHTLSTVSMSHQEILYLRDQVQKLQHKSMVDSANMVTFFRKLQEAVEVPLRQFSILQGLRDPRMHNRYENVDTAHRKTFKWLLYGPEETKGDGKQECAGYASQSQHPNFGQTGALIQAKHRQHKDLNMGSDKSGFESLSRGDIFRIAGKPGAGKSTLMKFICESEATLEHLKAWSGEKHLICAKAFFWRLGDDEQKSFSGLVNCLLHQILKAAPELIPFVFPSVWDSGSTKPIPFDPTARQAFDRLLGSGKVFEKHKVIFFIDGLDEFEGRHLDLISEIVGWTTRNPADLKICVASRQWNEFEVGFQGYPCLRIHEWTRDDIKIFVTDRFDEISGLSTSVATHDLKTLAEAIVDKAEGVFLWVRVVLAAIEQGVLNGDDFQDLEGKVAAFPSELKDLYQHLLDSIPECDRQKAFETLIFTHYQDTMFPQALLRYKFLGDISKDPDFAMKLSMRPLQEEELERGLVNTNRQINGRCKGFLEVSPAKRECHKGDVDVKFMHSTVAEFLNQPNIREIINPRLSSIDMMDRLYQSFLAFAKSIDTDEFYSILNEMGFSRDNSGTCPFILQLNRIIRTFLQGPGFYRPERYVPGSTSRFLGFLGQMEQIASQRVQNRLGSSQRITHDVRVTFRNAADHSYANRLRLFIPQTQLISVLAARHLLFEYFDEDGPCDLRALHQVDPVSIKEIVHAILGGVFTQVYTPRAFKMLEILFRNGISPNVQIEWRSSIGKFERKWDLWSGILGRLIFIGLPIEESSWVPAPHRARYEKGFGYQIIELCLRYGAGEDFILTFGPCYEVIGVDRLIVQVHGGEINDRHTDLDDFWFEDIWVDYHLEIVRYARNKGGVLTLRDILAYCFPQDCHHLYELLDKKHPAASMMEREDGPNSSHSIVMPILFPEENRYFEDNPGELKSIYFCDMNKPKHCKPCLAHSEKCFEDFEAKLKNKERRTDK